MFRIQCTQVPLHVCPGFSHKTCSAYAINILPEAKNWTCLSKTSSRSSYRKFPSWWDTGEMGGCLRLSWMLRTSSTSFSRKSSERPTCQRRHIPIGRDCTATELIPFQCSSASLPTRPSFHSEKSFHLLQSLSCLSPWQDRFRFSAGNQSISEL